MRLRLLPTSSTSPSLYELGALVSSLRDDRVPFIQKKRKCWICASLLIDGLLDCLPDNLAPVRSLHATHALPELLGDADRNYAHRPNRPYSVYKCITVMTSASRFLASKGFARKYAA